jgi:hypothetical protein
MGAYAFLRCLLPSLPDELGGEMPLPFEDIAGIIRRNVEPRDYPLLEACLFSIDVSNLESFDMGRDHFREGGVLTREDIQNRKNLPLFAKDFFDEREKGINRPYVLDKLWERYYMYVYSLAMELGCPYLSQYIPWEVGLRNILVTLRTRKSGKDSSGYTMLTNLGAFDFSSVTAKAGEERNPLLVERYLDEERLKYVFHCEGSDPFSFDGILAYLSRSAICDRWAVMNSPYDVNTFLDSGVQV